MVTLPERLDIAIKLDSLAKERSPRRQNPTYIVTIRGREYEVRLDRKPRSEAELETFVRDWFREKGPFRDRTVNQFMSDSNRSLLMYATVVSGAWFLLCWMAFFTDRWVASGFTRPPK
jgi:hypothetical protein